MERTENPARASAAREAEFGDLSLSLVDDPDSIGSSLASSPHRDPLGFRSPIGPHSGNGCSSREGDARQIPVSPIHGAAEDMYPSLFLALTFGELEKWKQKLVRWGDRWPVASSACFFVAMLFYVAAAVVWCAIDEETATSDEWTTYNLCTLCGATLFMVEPFFDLMGVWAAAWRFTFEQVRRPR